MQSVHLEVWRVPRRDVLSAVVAGRRRLARLRADPAVTFAKLLGTASATFTPWRATPTRWALLWCGGTSADDPTSDAPNGCVERASLLLHPIHVRGSWDGVAPFAVDGMVPPRNSRVLALTRSTLRARKTVRFYRAVPAIAADVRADPACRAAFGIGESPLFRQGTVSLWDSAEAVRAFAYGTAAHRRAVEATPTTGWYAEELFARFAVVAATGSIDGTALG